MTDRATLPWLAGRPTVTDGGLETELIFRHGLDLPDFAAFPLLARASGRVLLERYYDGYARIARDAAAGLLLESATWRASPDWGTRLGYDTVALARANEDAIELLHRRRDRYRDIADVAVGGTIGPRGDGYRPGEPVDPDTAAEYHAPQLAAFARAGAELATAYTLSDVGEAIGIVRAARAAGVPIAISFTVETDGRLAPGRTLADALAETDATAAPDYFLVNCAHPEHVARGLADSADAMWRERIVGLRCNASTRSHAELDEAAELDEGDPGGFGAAHDQLRKLLPSLAILGGCCGTDARHVASLWAV